jgi:hypothetical protein
MSSPPAAPTPEPGTYIRARAGGEVDARRVLRVVMILTVLGLVALVIVTTIGAANQNSVQSRLQRDGVPVKVTVTRCEGVTSGIGQALQYTSCRGDYTLGGHTYNEVIGGNRIGYPVGQTLEGVAVPGHPALLSTATAVAKKFSRWTPYITPLALAAVTAALVLLLWLAPRWRRRAVSKRQLVSQATVGWVRR